MTESQNSRTSRESADVVVLGAGPAGLVLGILLHAAGIDCVILERASRTHVQTRARAGFLAPNTVRILDRHGLADGLHRHGRRHGTCEFRTEEGRFRLDYGALGQGAQHHVYPQQNLVTDLLTHYLDIGGRIRFDTEALAVRDADGTRPSVTTRAPDGRPTRWTARYVAGCDGRHGAARRSLPPDAVRHHHDHGVTWLGLLAETPPSLDAVGYAIHDRGFAGHMARTPEVTRYYLQWQRGVPADAWPEQRIWDELDVRMRAADHGPLHRGAFLERGMFDLTCDVIEPLRHGSLFLAGDAASLLAPAAAKGANLAVLEAEILAGALIDAMTLGDEGGLDGYSDQCLAYIWRAQEFTGWMTRLLHAAPDRDEGAGSSFHAALRRSRLTSLRASRIHQEWFAENYVGV
ncbi:4-hydroxybenzoate 3-monooxygenase [Streptomyces sp. NBC_01565]|uniref:4-hydroxybenzoate 3-monooxygenase n=1 Tax=Streptomyces sp. NBC_01565 TaxID=2975881 RepID=UPI00224EB303|nr:4-hydroxybenzoate 3-monooxygenase [Streptomyces sp. NBC_01565]MCX4546226.1 4-hydroxybenzoate 3-monooxygenase [Streptomyces sp. NBC_01565]